MVQGDWEPVPKDSKIGARENHDSLSKLLEAATGFPAGHSRATQAAFPDYCRDSVLFVEWCTQLSDLPWVYTYQAVQDHCRWYNTSYCLSDRESRRVKEQFLCWAVTGMSIWAKFITFIMGFSREDLLVWKEDQQLSARLYDFFLWKNMFGNVLLSFIFSFIYTKRLIHGSTSNCPHSTFIMTY